MAKTFIDETLTQLDRTMEESAWKIVPEYSGRSRVYRAKLGIYFCVACVASVWHIAYRNKYAPLRLVEFRATGNPDKDYVSILDNILKIIY